MKPYAPRYSIAFLLFACLCVAGYLAGHRAGFADGYASGKAKRRSEEPYAKVYDVGDIIRHTRDSSTTLGDRSDYTALIDASQRTVFPDEWELAGGPCTMTPIPWLEALAVNATSGVHDRLESFYGDFSSLEIALADSKKEFQARQRAREARITSTLNAVAKQLKKELLLINADFDVIGTWDVERVASDGSTAGFRYDFVDTDTVLIDSGYSEQSTEFWYTVSPSSMVVSGRSYIAATTIDGALVLIPGDDPQAFLVAKQYKGEP